MRRSISAFSLLAVLLLTSQGDAEPLECIGKPIRGIPESSAIKVGKSLFLSRMPAFEASGKLAPSDFPAQTKQVMNNFTGVLKAAGTDWTCVDKTAVPLVQDDESDEMNRIYGGPRLSRTANAPALAPAPAPEQTRASGDGSANAPSGAPQYPNLLSGYAVRPNWRVAGVDYRVGINTGVVLKSPNTLASNSALRVSGTQVRCTGASAVTIDSVDFTGYTFYNGTDGCANVTITNSKFACPSSWSASAPWSLIADQMGANFTLMYNELYGDNCGIWPKNTSDPVAVGNVVFQYNRMQHFPERHVSPGGKIDYRFNLIDQPLTQTGAHENYLQWWGGANSAMVAYNTTYNAASTAGAEGFQFYTNQAGSFSTISFTNNTMIAKPLGGRTTMSYMVHGNCHSRADCSSTVTPIAGGAINANNFFDASGAFAAYYTGTFTSAFGWTNSGNIDMNTGATITPR